MNKFTHSQNIPTLLLFRILPPILHTVSYNPHLCFPGKAEGRNESTFQIRIGLSIGRDFSFAPDDRLLVKMMMAGI
jgi:hypothetical protein